MGALIRYMSIAAVATIALILTIGCEGDQGPRGDIGPTGPTGPPGEPGEITPFITGIIRAPEIETGAQNDFGAANIVVSKIPSLPTVRVNGVTIGQILYQTGDGLTFYSTDVPVAGGDQASLTVDYLSDSGDSLQASTGITVPGDFSVTPDSLAVGESDTVRTDWSPSTGADGYYLVLGSQVEYTDTLGNRYRHSFDLDTILTDTFFEMAAAPFFPAEVDPGLYLGPQYVTSYAHVLAISGPVLPGEPQNMSGDGYGFIYGENLGPQMSLELELPAVRMKKEANLTLDRRLLDYLSKMHLK